MPSVRTMCILTLLLATMLLVGECFGQRNQRPWQRNRSQNRGSEDNMEASQTETECHVHISTTTPTAGTCGRLWHMAVCRAGVDVDLHNEECYDVLAARTTDETSGSERIRGTGPVVECIIYSVRVQSIPGRCIRLGGSRNRAVCQSGLYLNDSEECQRFLAASELNK